MTISIARPQAQYDQNTVTPRRVEPADVWDLTARYDERRQAAHVRTLATSNRIHERQSGVVRDEQSGLANRIETRREKRAASLMGALLGFGLLAGAALGGAFGGGDNGYAPNGAEKTVASIQHYGK